MPDTTNPADGRPTAADGPADPPVAPQPAPAPAAADGAFVVWGRKFGPDDFVVVHC
jgi:hypothetical protein